MDASLLGSRGCAEQDAILVPPLRNDDLAISLLKCVIGVWEDRQTY